MWYVYLLLCDKKTFYTGITNKELNSHLKEKEAVLKWLVKKNINTVEDVGRIIAQYYNNPDKLFRSI